MLETEGFITGDIRKLANEVHAASGDAGTDRIALMLVMVYEKLAQVQKDLKRLQGDD